MQPNMPMIHRNDDAGKRQLTSGASGRQRVPLLDLLVIDFRKSRIKGLEIFPLAALQKLNFCGQNSIIPLFFELLLK